jgi:uncharacterized protein
MELDLYFPNRRLGIKIQRSDAPKRTRSMEIALADLGLERLLVVYPGQRSYEISEHIRVVPLSSMREGLD